MNKRDINTIASPEALARLDAMIAEKYKAIPEHARPNRAGLFKVKQSDRFYYSKLLEKMIVFVLRNTEGTAKVKVNVNRGLYVDTSKIVQDVLGNTHYMEDGYFIPDSKKIKGEADISAVIKGRAVDIEIKVKGDRQSDDQKSYEAELLKAGGYYYIVKRLDDLFELL